MKFPILSDTGPYSLNDAVIMMISAKFYIVNEASAGDVCTF